MKKFQYPILKSVLNVLDDLNIKKHMYLFSELFKNKISILLPHIFGNDILIGEIAVKIVYLLSKEKEIVKAMIENGMIEDILLAIDIEVKKEESVEDDRKRFSKLNPITFSLLETLNNLLNMMKNLEVVNHEHVLSLFRVLLIYFSIIDSFLSLPSVVSLTLRHYLLNANEKNKSDVLMIADILLKYLKIGLECLDEMKGINSNFYQRYNESLHVESAFELLKGVMRVFSVFEKHKREQHVFDLDFLFREYDLMHINVRVVEFIRKLLEDGKLITFINICKDLFEFENFEYCSDFDPFVFYLFILKRTINPKICYDNCDFPSFLNKYPSNFMTCLGLSIYCDSLLNSINKPLIIILKYLFSEMKRKEWINIDEMKLLIEMFSDVNEEYFIVKCRITAEECDEASENGCLDDVIDFILEKGEGMEKEKEEKENSHKEMLWKDLSVIIITRIYKTIMESSNEEYKKRLNKRIEDKNIIIRIISLLEMKDELLYIKYYYNILRLILSEYEEISEEQRFKEIITPILDFIKKYYINGECDSSTSSSSSSLSGCISLISDGIVLTSLEVLFFYVKENSEKQ
jgi:hypothetical protein